MRRGYGKNDAFRMSTCRKSKIYSVIQKRHGAERQIRDSFYKEQGRARTKQIYKFDE